MLIALLIYMADFTFLDCIQEFHSIPLLFALHSLCYSSRLACATRTNKVTQLFAVLLLLDSTRPAGISCGTWPQRILSQLGQTPIRFFMRSVGFLHGLQGVSPIRLQSSITHPLQPLRLFAWYWLDGVPSRSACRFGLYLINRARLDGLTVHVRRFLGVFLALAGLGLGWPRRSQLQPLAGWALAA